MSNKDSQTLPTADTGIGIGRWAAIYRRPMWILLSMMHADLWRSSKSSTKTWAGFDAMTPILKHLYDSLSLATVSCLYLFVFMMTILAISLFGGLIALVFNGLAQVLGFL